MEYIVIFAFGVWCGYRLKTPSIFKKVNARFTHTKRKPVVHGDYEEVQAELRSSNPNAANIQ